MKEQKKKKALSRSAGEQNERLKGYILAAPAVILLTVFTVYPLGYLIYRSLYGGNLITKDPKFVGFDNYLYPGLPDRRITTYEVDMKGLAQVALKKILKRMEDPEAMKRMDLVAGHIVEKDSVRPPQQGQAV